MKYIGYLTTALLTIVLGNLWSGYVLSVLWRWFIVPVFSLPALTVGYAIGLSLLVGYLTKEVDAKAASDDDSATTKMGKAIGICAVRPLLALSLGWVVHSFIS